MMKITPLNKNVIVEPIRGRKTTESGIVLSTSLEPDKAKIVAVGISVTEVKENDIVLIDWKKTKKIDSVDEQYIVSIDNVIFIYE